MMTLDAYQIVMHKIVYIKYDLGLKYFIKLQPVEIGASLPESMTIF